MQDSTGKKRIIFIVLYIILFVAAGFLLYKLVSPAPTCTDGKKNQDEREVDCGGQCKPCRSNVQTQELRVSETAFVDGGNGTYDVVARIVNPNYLTGLDSFPYEIQLKDESGNVIASRKANGFILPADSKYLVEIGLRPMEGKVLKSAEIVIGKAQWKELTDISNPQLDVNNKKYEKNSAGFGSVVSGVVKNNSPYDLDSLNVVVVARDQYGKVLGLNVTKKEAIRAKEERSFMVSWPLDFKAEVSKLEIEAQSNIYSLNYGGNQR